LTPPVDDTPPEIASLAARVANPPAVYPIAASTMVPLSATAVMVTV
jgi:hypothetical protein